MSAKKRYAFSLLSFFINCVLTFFFFYTFKKSSVDAEKIEELNVKLMEERSRVRRRESELSRLQDRNKKIKKQNHYLDQQLQRIEDGKNELKKLLWARDRSISALEDKNNSLVAKLASVRNKLQTEIIKNSVASAAPPQFAFHPQPQAPAFHGSRDFDMAIQRAVSFQLQQNSSATASYRHETLTTTDNGQIRSRERCEGMILSQQAEEDDTATP